VTQLAFTLPHRAALGRGDFFVSDANGQALAALECWRDWPGAKMVLVGPAGAGKTHLAHVWADLTHAVLLDAATLDGADLPHIAAAPAVVVEDCDHLTPPGEVALFHLHNMLAARKTPLLLTAATPPRDWGLTLPDLASRAQATALARIAPPDDALLAAVLVKLFADRQIIPPPALITYLLPRIERSFDAARVIVADLDAAALARGCAVSRNLAATLLDNP
jgi:chromosomal replication initiation ATPase DnaA